MDCRRLLSAAELRPLYEQLARRRRPARPARLVSGSFGGLRLAIGARDLLSSGDGGLARVFAALEEVTAPLHGFGYGRHAALPDLLN